MNDIYDARSNKGKGIKTVQVKERWLNYRGVSMIHASIIFYCSSCGVKRIKYYRGEESKLQAQNHYYCSECEQVPLRIKYLTN